MPIRELRDLTRYRAALIGEHTRETNRLQKVLEDAGIKLASVASNVLGVSGRAMLEALTHGTRNLYGWKCVPGAARAGESEVARN